MVRAGEIPVLAAGVPCCVRANTKKNCGVEKNWQTAARKPVKNSDLWKEIDALAATHTIDWRWVKGHSGHVDNERVDDLANRGIDELLEKGTD